jgi:hypothetical protein
MNPNWLSALVRKCGAKLCDQRVLWKDNLAEASMNWPISPCVTCPAVGPRIVPARSNVTESEARQEQGIPSAAPWGHVAVRRGWASTRFSVSMRVQFVGGVPQDDRPRLLLRDRPSGVFQLPGQGLPLSRQSRRHGSRYSADPGSAAKVEKPSETLRTSRNPSFCITADARRLRLPEAQ